MSQTKTRAIFQAILALSLASCGTTEQDPTGACGTATCPPSYEADFTLSIPGTYAIAVAFDTYMVTETCKLAAGAACTCDQTDVKVSATCTSSTITLFVQNAAQTINLTVSRDGTQVFQSERTPTYSPGYPNGSECEPICTEFAEMLTLPLSGDAAMTSARSLCPAAVGLTLLLSSRGASACGASAGATGAVGACSMADHAAQTTELPSPWRVGAGYVYTATKLELGGTLQLAERRQAVLATLDRALGSNLTASFAAGAVIAGRLDTVTTNPGPVLAAAMTYRAIGEHEEDAFLAVTGQLTASRVTLADGAGTALTAFDLRLGVLGGLPIGFVTPYLAARVFGGPVYTHIGGESLTGTDLYHYQLAGGFVVRIGERFDLYGEGVPLGERGFSAGLGWRI